MIFQFIGKLWNSFIIGFGLIEPHQNDLLYPIVVIGCILVLVNFLKFIVLGSLVVIFDFEDGFLYGVSRLLRVFVGSILYSSMLYVLIIIFWHMLLPNINYLVNCPKQSETLCSIVSVTGRTTASFFAAAFFIGDGLAIIPVILTLILSIIVDIDDNDKEVAIKSLHILGRAETFVSFVVYIIVFYSWYVSKLPSVAIAFAGTLFISTLSFNFVTTLLGSGLIDLVRERTRTFRIKVFVGVTISVVLLTYVWIFSGIKSDYILLIGIYVVLTSIDTLFYSFLSIFNPTEGIDTRFMSTMRFPFVGIVIATLTLLAASPLSTGYLNAGFATPLLLFAAGAAAFSYALFQPLTDAVRLPEYIGSQQVVENNFFARIQRNVVRTLNFSQKLNRLFFGNIFLREEIGETKLGKVVESDNIPLLQGPYEETSHEEALIRNTNIDSTESFFSLVLPKTSQNQIQPNSVADYRRFKALAFPSYIVFLLAAYFYYLVSKYISLPSTVEINPINLAWQGLPVILGAFSAINSLKLPKRVTNFSFFLLLITFFIVGLLVTANIILFNAAKSGVVVTQTTSDNILYWVNQIARFLEVVTLFMLVGHIFYLSRILVARFTKNEDLINER